MTAHRRLAAPLAAVLAFAAGLWGWHASEWSSAAQTKSRHGIVVVVNDEIITGYDIDQRARFLGLGAKLGDHAKASFERLVKDKAAMQELQADVIRNNPGKSRDELVAIIRERLQKKAFETARASILPRLRKKAEEDLIEDRLKVQGAKKLGIVISDAEVNQYITQVAKRNNMTYQKFAQHLKGSGVDVATMGEKFRTDKAWRTLIGRRYAAQVSVTQRDVDLALSAAAVEAGADTVELQVQRISLDVSGRAPQAALVKRYAEAEGLRRRFGGCKSMKQLAEGVRESKFLDMKYIKPGSIGEPTRTLLLSAKDNAVLPPVATSDGVELYAVCGRRAITGNEKQRSDAMNELQSKELERFARSHLRSLKQEASIEYK